MASTTILAKLTKDNRLARFMIVSLLSIQTR